MDRLGQSVISLDRKLMESDWIDLRSRCLEEGAEEFFLKPVRLCDVNKLKPHMMKTKLMEDQNQEEEETTATEIELESVEKEEEEEEFEFEMSKKRKGGVDEESVETERRRRRFDNNGVATVI